MAKLCPSCGGNLVGCPVCDAPPKRVSPKAMSSPSPFRGRLRSILMGSPVWEVQGIDISKWNGTMNFAVTKTKCQYAFLRAGYGNGWKDPNVDTYYANANSNDFPVGFYWFCYIGQDIVKHAEGFASYINTHPHKLDDVIDAETSTLDPYSTLVWLKELDSRLGSLTNRPIDYRLTYTAPGIWNGMVQRSTYWTNRKLWDAAWTTADAPRIPYDFSSWTHWQWSADGNRKAAEYGSTGGDYDMDLDRFNGTVAQFNARYGTHIQPIGSVTPPVTPPTNPEYVIINTGELAIRSTPQILTTNTIGHALFNTKWYPYEMVNSNGINWYRVGKNAYISANYVRLP